MGISFLKIQKSRRRRRLGGNLDEHLAHGDPASLAAVRQRAQLLRLEQDGTCTAMSGGHDDDDRCSGRAGPVGRRGQG